MRHARCEPRRGPRLPMYAYPVIREYALPPCCEMHRFMRASMFRQMWGSAVPAQYPALRRIMARYGYVSSR